MEFELDRSYSFRSHDESHIDPAVHEFIIILKLDRFCEVAATCRNGLPSRPGKHIVGGFNVLQELIFPDGVAWLARIPLPTNCFQPDECTLSYVAVLKYIKKQSRIPVPEVYHYTLGSDPDNLTGTTYLLMEQLPGHELPTLELDGDNDNNDDGEWSPEQLLRAKKVHEQLTDIIVELASLKFDKIGSLREDSKGGILVTEYIDPNTTAFPEERATAFQNLDAKYRGPFSTVSEFYHARCVYGEAHARIDPDEENLDETLEDFGTLDAMIPKFQMDEYEHGPFVLFHDDLTVQNILVDDDFNITGIIDFPGTTGPVQSLRVYPWLFHDNYAGPVADRDLFHDVFTTREASNPSSILASKTLRKKLLDSAMDRHTFERSLQGVYTAVTLPAVYQSVYGKPYRGSSAE